jgi:hypothetical protein
MEELSSELEDPKQLDDHQECFAKLEQLRQ